MKMWKNKLQRLQDENADLAAELEGNTWDSIYRILGYVSSYGISPIEEEIIKSDLIGLGREAELRKQSVEERLGVTEEQFSKAIVKETKGSGIIDRLEQLLYYFLVLTFCVYAVFFLAEGCPKLYGFSWQMMFFILVNDVTIFTMGKNVRKRGFYEHSRKEKAQRAAIAALCCAVWIAFAFMIFGFDDRIIIEGNGWLILLVVGCAAAAAFAGNYVYVNRKLERMRSA